MTFRLEHWSKPWSHTDVLTVKCLGGMILPADRGRATAGQYRKKMKGLVSDINTYKPLKKDLNQVYKTRLVNIMKQERIITDKLYLTFNNRTLKNLLNCTEPPKYTRSTSLSAPLCLAVAVLQHVNERLFSPPGWATQYTVGSSSSC